MVIVPKPRVVLIVNGVDVGSELSPYLLSFTYQDFHHGQADEIEVELQDALGKWRGGWRPEHGDKVQASIGYDGGPVMPCGTFEVDEPEASGSRSKGDTLKFRAIAAAPTKKLRSKQTFAYENQSLKQIADQVSGRNGLSVTGVVENITFKRVTQRRERDLEFLTRMAEDYGHYFTVKGSQLVFVKRKTLEGQGPVRVIETDGWTTLTNYSLRDSTHKTYSKAKCQYLDPDKKKKIEVEASDSKVKTGDTLNVDDRVENEGQAKKLAESRLAKANDEKRTGSLTLVGDPSLVAGIVIELGGSFGKWAGRYLVRTARHAITRSGGYTTELEIKGID